MLGVDSKIQQIIARSEAAEKVARHRAFMANKAREDADKAAKASTFQRRMRLGRERKAAERKLMSQIGAPMRFLGPVISGPALDTCLVLGARAT